MTRSEAFDGQRVPGGKVVGPLLDNLFRRQSGRLIAVLSRHFGLNQIDLVEDAVHDALEKALRLWPLHGVPDDPAAWLFKAARNSAIDALRKDRFARSWQRTELARLARVRPPAKEVDEGLALIFACSHPRLNEDAALALTLNVACGFGSNEVASALLLTERAASQRIIRAKRHFKAGHIPLELPAAEDLPGRLEVVLRVCYLMFNEGYSATGERNLLREELCDEALRLTDLLLAAKPTALPEVHALRALFLFQRARFATRLCAQGELCLLERQDRKRWDGRCIAMAAAHLKQALNGCEETVYHLEAAIAAHHTCAPSYRETPWAALLELYDRLYGKTASAIVGLNRAVVVGRLHGPAAGLLALKALEKTPALRQYHWYYAARAEFLRECGRHSEAAACYKRALKFARNPVERTFIQRRMQSR